MHDAAGELLFVPGFGRFPREYVESLQDAAGFCRTPEDGLVVAFAGDRSLSVLPDVDFFEIDIRGDRFEKVQASIFHTPGSSIVLPVVGGLVGVDGPLDDQQLESLGIRRVRDAGGNSVTYPMFAHSARSLVQPCQFGLSVVVVDRMPFFATSQGMYEDIFRKIFGDGADGMIQDVSALVDQSLRNAWKENGAVEPYEKFRETQFGQGFIYLASSILQHSPHPMIRERVKFLSIPCCAFQFKGAGCLHYDGNYVRPEAVDGDPNLRLIRKRTEDASFVVDTRYEGLRGIIMPVAHQYTSGDPVGGNSSLEGVVYERQQRILDAAFGMEWSGGEDLQEEMLWRASVLSGWMTGLVPIVDRDSVPELTTKDVCVSIIAVPDDTRRLDMFRSEDRDMPRIYRAFAVERFGGTPDPEVEIEEWVAAKFDESREKHLAEFFPRLALMTRSVLGAGLTNPQDQNLAGNISVMGGITDLADLAEMERPDQAIGFIFHLLAGVDELGKAAGFSRNGIFRSEHFKSFLRTLYSSASEPLIRLVGSDFFSRDPQFAFHALCITMTDAWVAEQGAAPVRGSLDERLARVPSMQQSADALKKRLWGA